MEIKSAVERRAAVYAMLEPRFTAGILILLLSARMGSTLSSRGKKLRTKVQELIEQAGGNVIQGMLLPERYLSTRQDAEDY